MASVLQHQYLTIILFSQPLGTFKKVANCVNYKIKLKKVILSGTPKRFSVL
jgi:hypothetical protein